MTPIPGTILAFDPGETTGWACLRQGKVAGGSFSLWSEVERLVDRARPDVVVVEDFLLYPNKMRQLKWNRLRTIRVIGVIEFVCQKRDIPCIFQLAKERLSIEVKEVRGFNIHATQALRHAILYASRSGDTAYNSLQTRRTPKNSYRRDDGLEQGYPKSANKRYSGRKVLRK